MFRPPVSYLAIMLSIFGLDGNSKVNSNPTIDRPFTMGRGSPSNRQIGSKRQRDLDRHNRRNARHYILTHS